jgi:putative ATP-binding cassette transporter
MLKQAWAYWKEFFVTNPDRLKPILMLVAVIGMELFTVFLSVQFNEWRNGFYNSLQNVDEAAFYACIKKFLFLAIIYVGVIGYKAYTSQNLQGTWRQWMTKKYITKWLDTRTYYGARFIPDAADNADQRIAEDIRAFVLYSMSLTLGVLSSVVTFFSFIYILWTLSSAFTFAVFGLDITIGHYLVWLAVIYSIVGTFITHKIGRPLVKLNFLQQLREANFRFSLVRTKENAESVALYQGEQFERKKFFDVYNDIYENYMRLIRKQKHLNWWSTYYAQIAVVFPYVISAPMFFAKKITLGVLMQTASAFDSVQGALSWLVDSYQSVAEFKAVMTRLNGLDKTFEQWNLLDTSKEMEYKKAKNFGFVKLSVNLPNGKPLVVDQTIKFAKAKRYVISGGSGVGKSTIIRSLAGIWPYASGTITTPDGYKKMFVSQETYLPHGTLLDAIVYPFYVDNDVERKMLVPILTSYMEFLDLHDLTPELLVEKQWDKILSGGQKQKVAFIRAIFSHPDVLFLDESTSNLDVVSEQKAYTLLAKNLPDTTIISVGHKNTIERYHDTKLIIKDKKLTTCRKR